MATDFGKGNRAIAFNPTSAFPLDARTYFEATDTQTAYEQALEVAKNAKEVGSTDSQYHYGMKILVNDNEVYTWYKIVKGSPYLEEEGGGGSGLPDYTDADNGKFLRLVDGEPTWVLIEDGNGVEY